MSAPVPCVCCGTALVPDRLPWLARCPRCDLAASRLAEPRYNGTAPSGWDAASIAAMTPVREAAAAALLARLDAAGLLARGARLLDVGCGPGWFLEAARAHGLEACGIEPDAAVAARARAAGFEIFEGAFPQACPAQRFDLVCFNDVFEHLAAPRAALAAAHRLLEPHGVLVLNLPSSRGVFYRSARALAALGIPAPLARLWQQGFASPHLFYFTPENLARLTAEAGFAPLHAFALPSVSARGLWARIRAGGRLGRWRAAAVYAALRTGLPLLDVLPADIMVHVVRRRAP